jgi:cobyrinic acid a,c-diamide synthase
VPWLSSSVVTVRLHPVRVDVAYFPRAVLAKRHAAGRRAMFERAAIPGLIVAAPRSGAGKTTVALGLMRALARCGMAVQPFKCGPDYIDPAFHAAATGRPGCNLDAWAMPQPMIAGLASRFARGADIAIAEGVMGLFDGAYGPGLAGRGATADIAAVSGWPVILVLDVSGQTETAAAVALGCARYREDVTVAGVILNRVSSARHASLIGPGFERIGLPLLGALPRDERFALPERHLGLVQAAEHPGLAAHLDGLAEAVAQAVDLDAVIATARPAFLQSPARDAAAHASHPRHTARALRPPGQRIALARDEAFSFAYPHLLAAWRDAGAEILPFSPLADEAPDPQADAVWLPGGYPELHAARVAAAAAFRRGMHAHAARGTPIHGECGGYMVLGEGLEDAGDSRHAMLGLLSLETSFRLRRLTLGYRRARLLENCPLGKAGADVFGHEFHYATMRPHRDEPLLSCCDAGGLAVPETGARRGSVSGTFFHAIAAPSARAS